jgi:hypothetical protein
MGYGDHWTRAQQEARQIVRGMGGADRATLVLFARTVEEAVRSTGDRGALEAAIDTATLSADSTRFAPALRVAQSRLNQSTLPRREAYLITDFQKSGWERQEEITLPEGAKLAPVSVAEPETSDLSISTVDLVRQSFAGEERVTATAGLINRSSTPVANLPVTFEMNGRVLDTRTVNIAPHASASVSFPPVTIAEANMQGLVRAGEDKFSANNVFHFVLSPSRPVSVLVVQGETGTAPSLYLAAALESIRTPPFTVEVLPVSRVTASTLERRSLVVLNDSTALPTEFDRQLQQFVSQGGGLFVILKDRSPWSGGESPIFPGRIGSAVDRPIGNDATLGFLDYSHPIFEPFKDARQASFAGVRFLRYRGLQPAPEDRVLARFDDGGTAMVERRVGTGRVIALAAPLDDSWTAFPKHAMFLPFVVLTSQYLARYDTPVTSYTVGRMLDVSEPMAAIVREGAATGAARRATGVVSAPSGRQVTIGDGGNQSIELDEQGFFSVRMQGTTGRPFAVGVNLDPAESDLSSLSPQEFVTSVAGQAAATASGGSLEDPELTPADIEKQQSVWWFLLLGAAAMLLGEATLANRLSNRTAGVFQRT